MSSADQQLQIAQQLYQARRLPEALTMVDAILARRPEQVEALLTRGAVFFRMNRPDQALASIDQALAINPRQPEAFLLKGSIHGVAGQYELSLCAYDQALALNPDLAGAWLGRGNVLAMRRRQDEALASYQKALALMPNYADAWLGYGNLLSELTRADEAFSAYDKALELAPDMANAWLGRGNLLLRLRRDDEASVHFDKALAFNPNLAEAWLGRGIIQSRQHRHNDALSAFERAAALWPNLAKVWLQAGIVLRELGRLGEAFAAFTKAVELEPSLAEGWFEIGTMEMKRKNYGDALSKFRKAGQLNPELPGVDGACFRAKMMICDWSDFDIERKKLLESFKAGIPELPPFFFIAAFDSPEDQLECARVFAPPADPQPIWNGERYGHQRIRVAYMSADFHEHPVAYLIAGMLERHDRSRFEITGLSIGQKLESDMRRRIQAACERFLDVTTLTDDQIGNVVRELQIDILVDLTGSMEGARTRVYAKRCAPIQVNYLGYPGTMGAEYYDYIIADRIVIPNSQRRYYSEKVVCLPDSYMVTDNSRRVSETRFTRTELGLPPEGFVYCCFNNTYKISAKMFDMWMRILARVDGSVLWLHERAASGADNLRKEAAARGVSPRRLVFAERLPHLEDHLARHRCADLFLDTLPFNAHTTATDALWAGLPVLTCPGESFAGRVAASLLNAIGLPELIATSAESYEELAIELATDRSKLGIIKNKLASRRQTASLFATDRFARALEAAYIQMYERHGAGLAPDHIDLSR